MSADERAAAPEAADAPEKSTPRRAREATREATASAARARRVRGALLVAAALALAGGILAAPVWGPPALSRLAFFHVRRVEIDGARYVAPTDVVKALRVDTMHSVWAALAPLARRVERLPQVESARVERRLPGTLRVTLVEKAPVALVPGGDGVAVYDASGDRLPIDPSRVGGVDAPVVASRDTALLRLLGALRADAPRLFARVSEARRAATARDEVVLALAAAPAGPASADGGPTLTVRAMSDVTAGRLADLLPVEDDLARRRVRVAEIDLRFRDQVIARLP